MLLREWLCLRALCHLRKKQMPKLKTEEQVQRDWIFVATANQILVKSAIGEAIQQNDVW